MNRRTFLSTALGVASAKADLLLPSDTPDELGFRLMWYNPVAPLDPSKYKLRVGGLVDKPLSLGLADLRKLPQESFSARMKCVQGWSARTTWGGFRFVNLLDLAKPQSGVKAIRIDCADKWYEYFPIEEMVSSRVLLVLDMAGKPLADRHGAPLRLLDPRRYGYKSAKLITSIEFLKEGKGSMACDIAPYYTPDGWIQAGYDLPLDLKGPRRKSKAGEITEY